MCAELARDHGYPGLGVPNQPAALTASGELLLRDAWMRYSSKKVRITAEGGIAQSPYVSSFDGESSRNLLRDEDRPDAPGDGLIFGREKNRDGTCRSLFPLAVHLRPLDPAFRFANRFDWRVVDSRAMLQDTPAVHLRNGPHDVWVDPARDYSVLLWQTAGRDGGVSMSLDLTYRRDPVIGWVPERWAIVQLDRDGSGRIAHSIKGTVTTHEIGLELKQNDFRLEFPAGSRVQDRPTGRRFRVLKNREVWPVVRPTSISRG
jgi:hypothetical protein